MRCEIAKLFLDSPSGESGESPERARHCKWGRRLHGPLPVTEPAGRRSRRVIHEPGDPVGRVVQGPQAWNPGPV